MPRFRVLLAIATVALVALPQAAVAQVTGGDQATDTSQAQQPIAITAADVVVRAEAAGQRLRQVSSSLEAEPTVEELAERLPGLVATRDGLLSDSAGLQLEGLSRRALSRISQDWTRYSTQVDAWQNMLTERSGVLGREQETLAQVRSEWQTTAEAAGTEGYPEAAVGVIGSTLAAIDSLDALVRSQLDAVLNLQNQASELHREASEVLARTEAAEARARLSLFTRERPPLWAAIAADDRESSRAEVRETISQDIRQLAVFWEDSSEDLPAQGLFMAVLLTLMIVLRRRSVHWKEEDPELEVSARIFDRPYSATLLILILTMRLFHPQAVLLIADIARLVILVPLIRLLPGLLKPALRRPFYAFAALWLLNELSTLLPEGSVSHRLALLIVTSLGLAWLIWVIKGPGPSAAEGYPRLGRAALRVAQAWVVTLAAAFVANVFGFVDLALLLTSATLTSILGAAALYAVVRLLEVLVRLALRTDTAQSIASVRRYTDMLARRAMGALGFVAAVIWLVWTLRWFDILGWVTGAISAVLQAPLSVGSLSISLWDILAFILAVWLALLASRLTRFVLEQDIYPRLALPRGVPGAISKLSHYTIIGLGIMIAVAAAGIDLSSLALLAGALGVGIGFGLQGIVNNFVSGLILIFERPIQVGDTITLDTLSGTVRNIGIRSSMVRSFEGADVIVPNGDLIASRVVNWTLSDRLRRIEIQVGVAYGSDPHQVKEILLTVAREQPDCIENPKPYVLFETFGDSALEFILRFWTSNYSDWLDIRSDATFAVHDALQAAGIVIPFPQRDVHIRSED
jgi:small-conductance mechanosensitive channel